MMNSLRKFIALEASGGILLLIVTVIAMVSANSGLYEYYLKILEFPLHLPFGNLPHSFHHWVNDGLMVIFFFVVGMEIKKEIVVGALSSPKKAALPMVAALGGMVAPALIFVFFNHDGIGKSGWGIPMATDIAFAVGVLALMSKRVPAELKVFLLALAIADDLGAVLVIAFFYTEQIFLTALALAASGFILIFALQKLKVRHNLIFILLGIFIWYQIFQSGVHATVAGVLLGFVTPTTSIDRLIHFLHPWVAYAIMPIFAFVNAGVHIAPGLDVSEFFSHPIALGIILGLFVGKPLGIVLFSFIACKLGWAQLPARVNWSLMTSVGFVAGIGFTMALFVGHLALKVPELEAYSKLAILTGSLFSAIVGLVLLRLTPRV